MVDGELQETVAVISVDREAVGVQRGVESSVASFDVHVALGVDGEASRAHPDAAVRAVGAGGEDCGWREGGLVEAENVPMKRPVVAVGGESDVGAAVVEGDGGALEFTEGVEGFDGRAVEGDDGAGSVTGGVVDGRPTNVAGLVEGGVICGVRDDRGGEGAVGGGHFV